MGNGESTPTAEDGDTKLSRLLDKIPSCGQLEDPEVSPRHSSSTQKGLSKIFHHAEGLCATSPSSAGGTDFGDFNDIVHNEYEEFRKQTPSRRQQEGDALETVNETSANSNPTSALFARALVNEVTDNPKTMTPAAMADREKKLIKAQEQAKKQRGKVGPKPVGVPGGIGQPSMLGTLSQAIPGTHRGLISRSKASLQNESHTVTIGLSLSRRHAIGHPVTVTRQTAFDFNELQDRDYKYVSSTDSKGWRAGGGECGDLDQSRNSGGDSADLGGRGNTTKTASQHSKESAPDTVHIPIIEIEAPSQEATDRIIAALARGEIFIPHMSILPEALSVNGVSPPDLVVRFGTERNDDLPPDEWPNWCLEFMHNQLFEYFQSAGARWTKRPFSITLAKKVRWKTVKHMNRYFAHAERVIDAWREKGPQYLDPQLAYIEGGATPEEVGRPHGIYLLQNGVPTNYFPPNFDPPYTTKMTRSLLLNVLDKSWDKKRREWTSGPMPRLVTPSMLLTTMCGCGDNNAGGFMANEVTMHDRIDASNVLDHSIVMTNAVSQPEEPMDASQNSRTASEAKSSYAEPDIPSPEGIKKKRSRNTKTRVGNDEDMTSREPEMDVNKLSISDGEQHRHEDTAVDTLTQPSGYAETPDTNSRQSNDHIAEPSHQGQHSRISSELQRQSNELSEAVKQPPDPEAAPRTRKNDAPESIASTIRRLSEEGQIREEKKNEEDSEAEPIRTMSELISDEDWLDAKGRPISSPQHTVRRTLESSTDAAHNVNLPSDPHRGRQKSGQSQMQKEQSVGPPFSEHSRDKTTVEAGIRKVTADKSVAFVQPPVQPNSSGVSLDYSFDSTLRGDASTVGGGSTLMGQHIPMDASVSSKNSRKPRSHSRQSSSSNASKDDDQMSSFSLQESTSSLDIVPTDEELFVVGWAKAMDPNSGSYYYFTLDRSKIVWDNPLSAQRSADSVES